MSYKKKTIKAGKVIDTTDYHTVRNSSTKRPRRENQNPTPAIQAKSNERRAYEKLYYVINANFHEDDLYLTCTYGKEMEEPKPKEAKKFLSKYLDKLRGLWKKAGAVLKYIAVTEHKKGRIHHHILINNIGLSVKHIKKFWQLGFTKIQTFIGEPEDCERLASYFIKESNNTFNTDDKVHGLRWTSSKNLIHPVPEIKTVHASSWREEPKPIKGYYIAFVKRGFTKNDYPYRHYRMIKIPDKNDQITFRGGYGNEVYPMHNVKS